MCGEPEAGNCFEANGTPGCNNLECCESVCEIDPFCCDVEWDALCFEAAAGNPACDCDTSDCCGAILVFRFLHRPLAQDIERVLAPGGLLLYETFTTQQRELERGPRNAAFLLEPTVGAAAVGGSILAALWALHLAISPRTMASICCRGPLVTLD